MNITSTTEIPEYDVHAVAAAGISTQVRRYRNLDDHTTTADISVFQNGATVYPDAVPADVAAHLAAVLHRSAQSERLAGESFEIAPSTPFSEHMKSHGWTVTYHLETPEEIAARIIETSAPDALVADMIAAAVRESRA